MFGDVVEREGVTVLPVAQASFGFGGGSTGAREGVVAAASLAALAVRRLVAG